MSLGFLALWSVTKLAMVLNAKLSALCTVLSV